MMIHFPLPHRVFPRTAPGAVVRTVFQLRASIDRLEANEAAWTDVVGHSLRWAGRKLYERLPDEAWTGGPAEVATPGHRLDCVPLSDDGLWSMRLEHPDRDVPGRTWAVDVALARQADALSVGIRVACASLPAAAEIPTPLSTPKIVRTLSHKLDLSDNWRLDRGPWEVSAAEHLEALHAHVADPERFLPVVVAGEDATLGSLDPGWLADQAVGLAHVVTLSPDMSRLWAAEVGRSWVVESGAVRTFLPGLKWDDSPATHPLMSSARVRGWPSTNGLAGDAHPFAHYLLGRLRQRTTERRVDWAPCVFTTVARHRRAAADRLRADQSRVQSAADAEWKGLYEDELGRLRDALDEQAAETNRWVAHADQGEKERRKSVDETRKLRHQLDGLRVLVRQRTGGEADDAIPIPDTLDGLPEWAEDHLAGRLILHARAHRGLKQAGYEEPTLVYRALLLLAGEYRGCCLGEDGAAERYADGLKRLGLGDGRSISKTRAGEQADEYEVRHPYSDSPKRRLDRHLTKGNSRQAGKCLRIHYFWDEDDEQVVVGWLPGHLDNRMT